MSIGFRTCLNFPDLTCLCFHACDPNFVLFYFLLCVYGCLPVYICVPHVPWTFVSQKVALDPLNCS